MLKYFRYLWYVIRHKYYVLLECCRLGITWLGIWHDWSKLRVSEFIPYARRFYGDTDDDDLAFDYGWLLHQKRNKHHWQYWVLQCDGGTKVLPVPSKYQREMLADWIGASRAQGKGKDIWPWWFRHRQDIYIDNAAYVWLNMRIHNLRGR